MRKRKKKTILVDFQFLTLKNHFQLNQVAIFLISDILEVTNINMASTSQNRNPKLAHFHL